MNQYELSHATAEAAVAYMKNPGDLEPLQELCAKAYVMGRQEQKRRDLEEAGRCDGRIVYGCPFFKG